jgi:hypothetical protein
MQNIFDEILKPRNTSDTRAEQKGKEKMRSKGIKQL